jgi:hypothetical protein
VLVLGVLVFRVVIFCTGFLSRGGGGACRTLSVLGFFGFRFASIWFFSVGKLLRGPVEVDGLLYVLYLYTYIYT